MPQTPEDVTRFKFRWINEDGAEVGIRRQAGSFDGQTLKLDDVEVPVVAIIQTAHREDRMIIGVVTEDEQVASILFAVTGIDAETLKTEIDVVRSAVWAEIHQQDLEDRGLGYTCRIAECRHCGATLVLSKMPTTTQLYCNFCDSLTTLDDTLPTLPREHKFKICDECGMFSKPQKFTIFYFYFLLVVYGFRSRTTWRCPACMRGDAWKMFFGNLPFVVGLPVAIMQLVRSYGSSLGRGNSGGLDTANLLARKGDAMGAFQRYRAILEHVPHSAGIKYNLALALLTQEDIPRAADTLEAALQDCSNYGPAFGLLKQCYEELGEDQKLARLLKQWDLHDGDAPISTVAEESQRLEEVIENADDYEIDADQH